MKAHMHNEHQIIIFEDMDIEMHGEKEKSMQPERAASPNTDGTLAIPLT